MRQKWHSRNVNRKTNYWRCLIMIQIQFWTGNSIQSLQAYWIAFSSISSNKIAASYHNTDLFRGVINSYLCNGTQFFGALLIACSQPVWQSCSYVLYGLIVGCVYLCEAECHAHICMQQYHNQASADCIWSNSSSIMIAIRLFTNTKSFMHQSGDEGNSRKLTSE